jgi:5-methylcytosine-specific restriction endonuclease McrA
MPRASAKKSSKKSPKKSPEKVPGKKSGKEKIPAAVKQAVWNTYVGEGNGIGNCYCCRNSVISQGNFACGHIKAEKNGGLVSIDNLRPICTKCNSSMGTMDMEEFIEKYGLHHISDSIAELQQKVAELEQKLDSRRCIIL